MGWQDCPAFLHFLNLGEKVLNRDIDIGSLKSCYILSISSKGQIEFGNNSEEFGKNLEGYSSVV